MPGRSITFHKRSDDGSGKCNMVELSTSTESFGALYEFSPAEKAALDLLEGLGKGYYESQVRFTLNDVVYQPFVYVASQSHIDYSQVPYHWYKSLVIAGARYHNFPGPYIAELESVPSKQDMNANRRAENEALLARMAAF